MRTETVFARHLSFMMVLSVCPAQQDVLNVMTQVKIIVLNVTKVTISKSVMIYV